MKSNSKLISTLQSSIENYEKANKTQSEQIENQNLIINELHSKLQDYEAIAMQNNELVKENQTLNDIIKNKNQMIAEFQKLTEESSNKFDVYINCNNELKSKLDEKKKKYKDISMNIAKISAIYLNRNSVSAYFADKITLTLCIFISLFILIVILNVFVRGD